MLRSATLLRRRKPLLPRLSQRVRRFYLLYLKEQHRLDSECRKMMRCADPASTSQTWLAARSWETRSSRRGSLTTQSDVRLARRAAPRVGPPAASKVCREYSRRTIFILLPERIATVGVARCCFLYHRQSRQSIARPLGPRRVHPGARSLRKSSFRGRRGRRWRRARHFAHKSGRVPPADGVAGGSLTSGRLSSQSTSTSAERSSSECCHGALRSSPFSFRRSRFS